MSATNLEKQSLGGQEEKKQNSDRQARGGVSVREEVKATKDKTEAEYKIQTLNRPDAFL